MAEAGVRLGAGILTQCGRLSIGDRRGAYIDAILRNVRETGTPHTVLDAAALRARYPQHRVSDDDAAVLDPRAGFLRTDQAVLSAVAAAESLGAQVLTSTPVDALHEDAPRPRGLRLVELDVRACRPGGGRVVAAPAAGPDRRRRRTPPDLPHLVPCARAEGFAPDRFPVLSGSRAG